MRDLQYSSASNDSTCSEPSLTAIAGGPLPVRPSHDPGEFELLAPRFEVEIEVPESMAEQLHSGQRGRIYFSIASRSMGSYLLESCQEWLNRRLQIAADVQSWD